MSDGDRRTHAAVRRSRWPGWIWAVPIAALAIVGWLGLRNFVQGGTEITITFPVAAGMKSEDTEIRYKGLKVGTVESIELTEDREHVIATVNMQSDVENLLREGTRFWIVGAEIGLGNLSALKTLIAGPYIHMDPGSGEPVRHFEGLKSPPAVEADAEGTRFVLHSEQLGSLGPGTPVTYLGLEVGAVEQAQLEDDGKGFRIHVFIREPYDRLVHDGSRFWNAGGVRLDTGSGGLEVRLSSPRALLSGMVAFYTPQEAATGEPSEPGHRFELYDSRDAATAAPIGRARRYLLRFDGAVGGLSIGSPVKLRGFTVGRIAEVRLRYDVAHDVLQTPVIIEIDAARLQLESGKPSYRKGAPPDLNRVLRTMIEQGLRARLERSPPVIGGLSVSLAFDPAAGQATLGMDGPLPAIPTTGSGGLDALTSSAQAAISDIRKMDLPGIAREVRHIARQVDDLVSSPKLEESLARLDRTLANIEQLTASATGKVGPMIDSLREAADAAQDAVASANEVLGGTAGTASGSLPAALEELTSAARAIRVLASYLQRHPEALIQGRSGP